MISGQNDGRALPAKAHYRRGRYTQHISDCDRDTVESAPGTNSLQAEYCTIHYKMLTAVTGSLFTSAGSDAPTPRCVACISPVLR